MSSEPVSHPVETPRRSQRRWVFGLRSLLIAVVVFCVLLGLYARREPYRNFVRKADEYRCNRHYYTWPGSFLVAWLDEQIGRGTLQNPRDLSFWESLGEPIHTFSDEEFGWLFTIHSLEKFRADGIYLNDELAAKLLDAHPNLRELSSQNARLTAAGVAAIAKHKNLKEVRIDGDATLNDSAVCEFEKMTHLEYLDVDSPAINSNTLLRLKKTLPNCKVHGPWDRD